MRVCFCLGVLFFVANANASPAQQAVLVGYHEGCHELLLSGNGQIAFSSDEKTTRTWDIHSQRELASLPAGAGQVVAVDETGARVLCRRSERKAGQELFEVALWWHPAGKWQQGTRVREATGEQLLDAQFVGSKVVLLWERNVQWLDAWGRSYRTRQPKNFRDFAVTGVPKTGALSPDGRYALALGETKEQRYAHIYDTSTGRDIGRIAIDTFKSYTQWEFSPHAKAVAAIVGEPVEPWNPSDGPQPAQYSRLLWNMRDANELSNNTNFPLAFWPNEKQVLGVRALTSPPGRLELYNPYTQAKQALPFSQPWEKRRVERLRFSRDGKTVAVLDVTGSLWAAHVAENLRSLGR